MRKQRIYTCNGSYRALADAKDVSINCPPTPPYRSIPLPPLASPFLPPVVSSALLFSFPPRWAPRRNKMHSVLWSITTNNSATGRDEEVSSQESMWKCRMYSAAQLRITLTKEGSTEQERITCFCEDAYSRWIKYCAGTVQRLSGGNNLQPVIQREFGERTRHECVRYTEISAWIFSPPFPLSRRFSKFLVD